MRTTLAGASASWDERHPPRTNVHAHSCDSHKPPLPTTREAPDPRPRTPVSFPAAGWAAGSAGPWWALPLRFAALRTRQEQDGQRPALVSEFAFLSSEKG